MWTCGTTNGSIYYSCLSSPKPNCFNGGSCGTVTWSASDGQTGTLLGAFALAPSFLLVAVVTVAAAVLSCRIS